MSRWRWWWALLALPVIGLIGLGWWLYHQRDPLVTTYGDRSGVSVNGFAVLHRHWSEAFATTSANRLSERLDETDLLIHLALGDRFPDRGAMPDDPTCAWIRAWLEGGARRQFVLVLRDGTIAPWLCRRWAGEARAEAARAPERQERFTALADRLEARAVAEEEAPLAQPDERRVCPLFTVTGMGERPLAPISGQHTGLVPAAMRLRSAIAGEDAQTLIAAGGSPYVVALPVGGSRLIVVANATPLFDAALVDPAARDLLASLTAAIAAQAPSSAAWVGSLDVREREAEPPNMLAQLFGTPPFSYAVFHLLALVLVFVGWKAAWLGRVSPLGDRTHERFSRHVDALAWHLRRAGAVRACAELIAGCLRRPLPRRPADVAEARALIAGLYAPLARPAPSASATAPVSAAGAADPVSRKDAP